MNDKRMFYVMCGITGLLFCMVLGGIVGANVLLKQRSDKLAAAKLDNRLLDEQQIALVQANKDITKYADLEKVANTIVPQDKDQAKTVREIVNIAKASNIAIASISFPSSTLGQTVAPKTTTTTETSPAPKIVTPPVTQVKPAEGIPNVYQMEITIQSDTTRPIPYSALIDFLSRLEHNRRTAQVSNISIIPNTKDISQITFSLGINVFIKP